MQRPSVEPESHETNKEVLARLPAGVRWYLHFDESVCCQTHRCSVMDAMLEVYADLSVQPRQREQNARGNEVVPELISLGLVW